MEEAMIVIYQLRHGLLGYLIPINPLALGYLVRNPGPRPKALNKLFVLCKEHRKCYFDTDLFLQYYHRLQQYILLHSSNGWRTGCDDALDELKVDNDGLLTAEDGGG